MPTLPELCAGVKAPHTWRGLSKIGYGMAKRILMDAHPKPKPFGVFAKGTAVHAYYQQVIFPEGKTFPDGIAVTGMDNQPLQIPPFEVVGHEQYVFVDIGGVLRWSPIDTLVYYPDTDTFGVWDYKSKKNGKYGRKTVFDDYLTEPEPEHVAQVQLYLDKFQGARPSHAGLGHIFYIDNDDWTHAKVAEVNPDPSQVALRLAKELQVVSYTDQNWIQYLDCIHSKWCVKGYCDYKAECLAECEDATGGEFADHDAVRAYLAGLK